MNSGEIACLGRCDGMGDLDPLGSYVKLVYRSHDAEHHIRISEGAAEVLANELRGAIHQRTGATVAELIKQSVSPE